jgi:hypothetical protein
MFKLKNKAFTLAEFSVILFVMSIVVLVTITTQKPFDKALSMSYNKAYRALYYAAYNINIDLTAAETFPVGDASILCNKLANETDGYINALHGYIFCDLGATAITNLNANSFTTLNRQFISNNGMIFYIATDEANGGFTRSITYNSSTTTLKYCIVYVDLNGDQGPNTALWNQNRMADIVAFVVTNEGEVWPIGYPTVDTKYFSARVKYPDGTEPDEINRYSKPMAYRDAKYAAWNNVTNPSTRQSIDFMYNPTNTDFNGSNLLITDSLFSTHASLDNTNGCVANTSSVISPCDVEINQYY